MTTQFYKPSIPESVLQHLTGEQTIFLDLFEYVQQFGFQIDEETLKKLSIYKQDNTIAYLNAFFSIKISPTFIIAFLDEELNNEYDEKKIDLILKQFPEKIDLIVPQFYILFTKCINFYNYDLFDKLVDFILERGIDEDRLSIFCDIICREDLQNIQLNKFILERLPNGNELLCSPIQSLIKTAIEHQNFSLIEKIIEKGFPVDAVVTYDGWIKFQRILSTVLSLNPEERDTEETKMFVKKLLELGASPNISIGDSISPIILCFSFTDYDNAKILISDKHFDFSTMHHGYSFYELCKDEEMRKFILEKGAEKGFKPRVNEEFVKLFSNTSFVLDIILEDSVDQDENHFSKQLKDCYVQHEAQKSGCCYTIRKINKKDIKCCLPCVEGKDCCKFHSHFWLLQF